MDSRLVASWGIPSWLPRPSWGQSLRQCFGVWPTPGQNAGELSQILAIPDIGVSDIGWDNMFWYHIYRLEVMLHVPLRICQFCSTLLRWWSHRHDSGHRPCQGLVQVLVPLGDFLGQLVLALGIAMVTQTRLWDALVGCLRMESPKGTGYSHSKFFSLRLICNLRTTICLTGCILLSVYLGWLGQFAPGASWPPKRLSFEAYMKPAYSAAAISLSLLW